MRRSSSQEDNQNINTSIQTNITKINNLPPPEKLISTDIFLSDQINNINSDNNENSQINNNEIELNSQQLTMSENTTLSANSFSDIGSNKSNDNMAEFDSINISKKIRELELAFGHSRKRKRRKESYGDHSHSIDSVESIGKTITQINPSSLNTPTAISSISVLFLSPSSQESQNSFQTNESSISSESSFFSPSPYSSRDFRQSTHSPLLQNDEYYDDEIYQFYHDESLRKNKLSQLTNQELSDFGLIQQDRFTQSHHKMSNYYLPFSIILPPLENSHKCEKHHIIRLLEPDLSIESKSSYKYFPNYFCPSTAIPSNSIYTIPSISLLAINAHDDCEKSMLLSLHKEEENEEANKDILI